MTPQDGIPAIDLPEQLRLLEANGSALIRERRHDEAERLFRQILTAAPRHVPALRYVASRALARGDLDDAQDLIERAIRLAPGAPMLHQHLGVILRARGYLEGALIAFDTSLRLNPELAQAWVQRGDVLQALRRHEEAAASYKRAEELAGDLLAIARRAQQAPRARRAFRRAGVFLARARESIVDEALAPLRRRHSESQLERAERAIRMMIRTERTIFSEPLQRPSFGYVPDLAARPFFSRSQFPFLGALESETNAIRDELRAILAEPDELSPYVQVPREHQGVWEELNRSAKWSSYHLYRNGERVTEHCARCPRTVQAVESLPLVRLQGQAPEIFLSILEPNTHIPPHHGIANYKLAVHLPLIIPSGCAIRVGDQTRTWTPGECLIFDDSFEHEAWNRSAELRVVLIFEVWHPDLTVPEREALEAALAALGRFHRKMSALREGIGVGATAAAAPEAPAPQT